MFVQLAVFAGGFSANGVVAVCGEDAMDEVDAAVLLDALVTRSMVVADRTRATTRYSLLETLRQFGEDILTSSGDTAASRSRHARHLLSVAESARRQLSTPQADEAMAIFAEEWDNLRVAFEWLASSEETDGALRLVVAAHWFATLSCQYELLLWAERAIAFSDATDHELWPAAAGVVGVLRSSTGDLAGGEAIAAEAQRVEERHGYAPRFEPALARGMARWSSGQTEQAIETLAIAEGLAERGKDPIELAYSRHDTRHRVLRDRPHRRRSVR